MITKIAHNAIKVVDMEKSLRFYVDDIGLEKAFEINDDQDQPWIVYLKICPGAFIELFYNGVLAPERQYAADLTGYHHFCIETDQIDELAQRLFEKGYIKEPKAGLGRDLNRNLWIHDPDGNAVEFVEYSPDSPHMLSNT